eukprot:CAMPEP_0201692368 /NCGR_PEP_ID=MMETSP0578-20130828/5276_1 /ASSEMBLY_ACC=CAM_ASM_000663 /TAXON_ID=267565 /ORGANISM="Skeletonema grethea, Strain CCMP 1804" /LENGTH=424 /DNA_ID=CAMNT_0048177729 /DNA_START=441 /DNA_END=1712 /DNA_ORIENTATION=+
MISFNEIAGNALLFFLVFGMSATVDIHMLLLQLKNIRAILMGVFLQFAILPMLGFLVVKFGTLERSAGISLLVVTSSPGGSYSNWWCSIFNADLALSVTMTAISTLLSVVLMPANLLIYSKYAFDHEDDTIVESLDFNSLFIALTVVISAIGLGLFASAKVHSYKFNIYANKLGNYAGISLVVFSALLSNTSGGGDQKIWNHEWQFYVGVMLPCLGGLCLSNLLTTFVSLNKPERVTLSVECCYQNVGIATSVALTMFQGEELATAMAVPLYYGLLEAVILGLYCIGAWKLGWTKAPKNINFFTMIGTSFEVLTTEHGDLIAIEVSLPKNQKDMKERTKMGSDGEILHLKHSIDDEEMNCGDAKCGWKCLTAPILPSPTKPKEPSGLQLPEVPFESEEAPSTPVRKGSQKRLQDQEGLHMYSLW